MQCRYLHTGTQTNKSYDSGYNNILLVTEMSMNLDNTNCNGDFFLQLLLPVAKSVPVFVHVWH